MFDVCEEPNHGSNRFGMNHGILTSRSLKFKWINGLYGDTGGMVSVRGHLQV